MSNNAKESKKKAAKNSKITENREKREKKKTKKHVVFMSFSRCSPLHIYQTHNSNKYSTQNAVELGPTDTFFVQKDKNSKKQQPHILPAYRHTGSQERVGLTTEAFEV